MNFVTEIRINYMTLVLFKYYTYLAVLLIFGSLEMAYNIFRVSNNLLIIIPFLLVKADDSRLEVGVKLAVTITKTTEPSMIPHIILLFVFGVKPWSIIYLSISFLNAAFADLRLEERNFRYCLWSNKSSI